VGCVSSQAQRPDSKNQRRIVEEFAIAKGIANLEFIEEIGGPNFNRPTVGECLLSPER
jgi:putative resolvase